MSSLPWVSCLLSAAVTLSGCKPAPGLQVLGESTRLAEGEPSPKTSAIFDGKVLRLRGARGETLGVSLRISDAKARRVRLQLPEVARAAGFSVRSLEVKEASTDMYGESRGVGRYPDILTPVAGAEVTADKQVYFDVAIADQATPGRYEGALVVSDQRFPVSLEVSSARIDLAREPFVWVFYLPRELAKAHELPDDDTPALLEVENRYHELFRAHGAFLAADLPPSRFEARRRFIHDVAYWPVAIDTSSDEAIERDVQRWLALFRGSAVTPFAIPIDEPHTSEARLRARHIADVIRRAGGGRPHLLCAVTDAWSPVYGDSMDVYLSPANFPSPASTRAALGERFWTYNGRPPSAGSLILDTDGVALRSWGWIAERYDVELWHAWEGLYFSDRYNRGGPRDVLQEPLTFDERRRGGTDFGNGDGILAYPGPLPSLRLKALRRGLSDRLLLRELARCGGASTARRIVRRLVPRALGEAQGQGRGSWSLEEPVWESARLEVLDAIEKECHEQTALAH
jgi:hypothetical protein